MTRYLFLSRTCRIRSVASLCTILRSVAFLQPHQAEAGGREPSLSAGRAPIDGCDHLTQSALAQVEYSRKAQIMQAVSPPAGGEPFLPAAQAGASWLGMVNIGLAKDVAIMFRYQFSGKGPEQVDGNKSKSHPVTASINRYACNRAYHGQDAAQDKFAKEIWKEQQDKQTTKRT